MISGFLREAAIWFVSGILMTGFMIYLLKGARLTYLWNFADFGNSLSINAALLN